MPDIRITLNGKEVDVPAGVTILEAARLHGIEIPTLCDDEQLEPYASCWLCAVRLEGMKRYVPSCGTKVAPGMKVHTHSEDVLAVRRMALELLLSNHRGDCIAPCKATCPAGVDVQGYIALIAERRYQDATALVKQVNPFPLAIGRVCTRPCEGECRRNAIDGPVAIDYLKRFAADWDAASGEPWTPPVAPATGRKIALVGAGPCSLTAAFYLAQMGHSCVVFEALPRPGGMLRYGIPEYRLPKATLDVDIGLITELGIEVEYGKALGCDFTLKDLLDRGFDVAFLGLGAMGSRSMRVPGEDLEGVWAGTEFLKKMGLGEKVEIGRRVAIIGGGNTAIDAARTALRLGAEKVTIVYRRSRHEMPAWDVEVEAALEEGVEMHFLAAPTKIEGDGRCERLEYIRMELGEPDESGRRRPVPIEGSESLIEVDNVIAAIGQVPDLSCIHDTGASDPDSLEAKLELTRWGTIVADEKTGLTSVERVFAGGDVVRGAATAIEAIADGGKAARAIGRMLAGGDMSAVEPFFNITKPRWDEFPKELLEAYERKDRAEMPELKPSARVKTFDETELGLSEEQALEETTRCLECGCVSAFTCKLRRYSAEYGASYDRFGGEVVSDPPDLRHPFIRLEPEKCILCARCVRICEEVEGASALGLFRRGFVAQMKPALDRALTETSCESCGQCVSACPTAALSAKCEQPKPGPWALGHVVSTCTFCGTGCSVSLDVKAEELVEVTPGEGITGGNLCVRGRFGLPNALSREPLRASVRGNGDNRVEVSLEETVQVAAKGLKAASGAVAVTGGARLTNEEAVALGELGRSILGTQWIGSFGLAREAPVFAALGRAFGRDASTATFSDMLEANVILLLDSDVAEEQTVAGLLVRKAVRHGAKLFVVSPDKTRMAKLAGDSWIQAPRRSYGAALGVMIDAVVPDCEVPGDLGYEVEGLSTLRKTPSLAAGSVVAASRERLAEAAREFAGAERAVLVANATSFEAATAARDATLVAALAAIAGKAGGNGSGVLFLRARANGQGLTDAGFASGRPNDAALWDAFTSGDVKAALIVGEDPVGGSDDPDAVKEALSELDFLVVADSFETETSALAHITLPLSLSTHSEGTFTNSDGRVQRVAPVFEPPSGASNLEILSALAEALGGKLPKPKTLSSGEAPAVEVSGTVDVSPPADAGAPSLFDPRWVDALESGLSKYALAVGLPPHVVRRLGTLTLTERR